MSRHKKVEMTCHCGIVYEASVSDLKRGWGLSHNKKCAAIRRKYGKPKAKPVDPANQVKKTRPKPSSKRPNDNRVYEYYNDHTEYDDCEYDPSWDAHKSYKE